MSIKTKKESKVRPARTLVDSYGRVATDLRISVTDRCNFRCLYCMPSEEVEWLPRSELLSYEEILRLVKVFIKLGIRSVRLTGGEPLVRAHLERLVRGLADLPLDDIALTTNGFLLSQKARKLANAGLKRVNVSLDTLDRKKFREITRADALDRVLEGLGMAKEVGLDPIKINCVVIRGLNDDEIEKLAYFAGSEGYHVRYIEFMPLDGDRRWSSAKVVPADEIVARLKAAFDLVPLGSDGPAYSYKPADWTAGSVGVIPSVTAPFCDRCDRIRLTADGRLRTCLFALEETDLKSLLREGASDSELADTIVSAVARKWAGHRIGRADFVRPSRSMYSIGG
jgi:cyclic pyranopterin phosphate synthase